MGLKSYLIYLVPTRCRPDIHPAFCDNSVLTRFHCLQLIFLKSLIFHYALLSVYFWHLQLFLCVFQVKIETRPVNHISQNVKRAKSANMKRAPSLTALDDLMKKQEQQLHEYKRGSVPK